MSKIPPKGRSLFDKNHVLALEWSDNNKKTPHEIFPSDRTKYLWICPVHGEYSMSCKSRVYLGSGCQTCGVEKVSKAKRTPKKGNSFSEKMPDLVNEWSSKNKEVPINVKWKSNDPYWWVCPNGHEWLATPNKRSSGRGCPVCSHKNNKPAINESLGEVYPDLINEWCSDNSRSIFEVYPGSHYKAIWVCNSCKYKWTTEVYHRSSGKGCPSCSSVILPPKEGTSLADLYPNLINEWSPSNDKAPWEVYPSSHYKAIWVCSKGHEWVSMCYSRTGNYNTGCPECTKYGTSFIEINLRNSLLIYGASKNTRIKLGPWKVDIYFPESKTVVEYDGSWAHSHPGSIERDKRKSLYLLTQGYRVIRIREISHSFQLSSLEIRNKNYFEIFYKNGYHKKYSSVPTQDLIEEVRRLFNET